MNPVLMDKDDMIAAMMDREAQKRFIADGQRLVFGEFAFEKGRRVAADMEKRYPGCRPSCVAARMGLVVEEKDGPGFYLSEYTPKKGNITLFQNTIQSGFIDEEGPHLKTTEYAVVRELFLAHELFHYLECTDAEVGLTYRERQVVVFSLGPFKWKTGLRSLSEIAAHSFAVHWVGPAVIP